VCLWFLSRDKGARKKRRDRRGEVLFIDARKLGRMETRVHRVLDAEDIERVSGTYHAWRNEGGKYEDVAGFCKVASLEDVQSNDFVLTPGRYVGAEDIEDDGEPFEEKMERLVSALREQQAEGSRLDGLIRQALGGLSYAV
jgi:type I restriction enzyme M protein